MFNRFLNHWKRNIWFVATIFFNIMYLFWRVFFTIPFGYGAVSVAAGFALLTVEVLGMVEAFIHYVNMCSDEVYPLPTVPYESFPHIDIFVPTYSEGTELLYKTLNACNYLKYPDRSKVHIYLCDDNRRPEMRKLAEKMGVNYLDRPDNQGAKAGNLNNALKHSKSPYIVTIDADMILKSDFLLKTVPYMVDCDRKNEGRPEEEKIKLGFIQTPQSFYNPDLFQFNLFSEGRIPNEQDYFYRDIQVARTKTNSVIYGGSNTLIRREALEAVGGFYTEAITEDFATGILIQRKQYVSLGIGEPMASGLSANDLQGLVQQRVRWARGVIATGRKMHIFTTPDLSFSQKMNYWASIWYWYAPVKRLIYIMSPILYAVFGFMVFKCTLPQILMFWLPMYLSSNINLRMFSNNIRNTKWTGIYETVMFPFLLLPVLAESFGITLKKFKVTKKERYKSRTNENLIYGIPFSILITLSIFGIFRCITIMFDSGSFGPIVVLFWLLNNLFFLIMALFFVFGRVPYRKAERVSVKLPCTISDELETVEGVTKDISENGVAIILKEPYYFQEETLLSVEIKTEDYCAKLKTKVVYVSSVDSEHWSYSMKIIDHCGYYDDLLGILYDRIPTLPKEIKKDSGSFEDLKLNSKTRILPLSYQKRQYPRVEVYAPAVCLELENRLVQIYDFNYAYLTLREESIPNSITLEISESLQLKCKFVSTVRNIYKLYSIENIQEIWGDGDNRVLLLDWLRSAKNAADTFYLSMDQEQKKTADEFNEMDLV
ncbi:glycosyltransferase [Sinanaerobacter sp. ZZT-01]|uniref:glycosyltransferase n=1 Tax=Sinanaerobacter sp. ZZT-01 TaxID=3111540 RepID=UPI002D7A1DD3|nr:glycosyltransferase [Sinanaerobacter sp. ZZT-01]WRR94958.1 glycosyltransferase [Sinanaerobacter sp. ZZT-01]